MIKKSSMMFLGGLMAVNNIWAEREKPNIIFVLVDDLGKEWIETCGADIHTPNINSLAEQGVYFERAYSMPQSTPSRAALLTGQYPYRSGWINHFDVPRWGHGASFDKDCNPSFPKHLKAAGYTTCIAGKWQLNDFRLQPNVMNELGFDEYCMWTGAELGNEAVSEKRYWDPYIHTKEGSKTYEGQFGPDIYSDFIVDFMKANKKKPFFVYYPMTLTHTPFVHTPAEPNAKTNYEKHCAMVRYTDYIIGKLLRAVKEQGLSKNTYLIFTTDNGTVSTAVGRRGDVYVRGGKTFLSENGINAPMFVIGPGVKKGSVSSALVDFTDVYPTLLELAGAKYDKSEIDGVSFADVIKGKRTSVKQFALSMGSHPALIGEDDRVKSTKEFRDRVIIGEQYKIYLTCQRTINRIYDLNADPYETKNLVDDENIFKEVSVIFADKIKSLPLKDASPKYNKLKHSPYNGDAAELNDKAIKKSNNYSNKMDLVTEQDYIKFKNRK